MKYRVLATLFPLLILLAVSLGSSAQSREAYIRAGQTCLERNDPNGALSHFTNAFQYGGDGRLFLLLGIAEKESFNYPQARRWLERALKEESESGLHDEAVRVLADILKRTGDFKAVKELFSDTTSIDSLTAVTRDSILTTYELADRLLTDTLPFQLVALGYDINSSSSDFAPTFIGDSILLYSSLRYEMTEKGRELPVSRLAQINLKNTGKNQKSTLLPATVNQVGVHNANASVSPDGKLMVFTRCTTNQKGRLICQLFESQNRNGKWMAPVRIETGQLTDEITHTQPCITTIGSEGYILFYSSDRPGGLGGLDIWFSRRLDGKYTEAENAGSRFNSSADERTPFYDPANDSLYFSSERAEGPGGLDIWTASFLNSSAKCGALPPPFNSGYNDLYYSRSYGTSGSPYLVSNRPPAKSVQGSYCCYDIFRLKEKAVSGDVIADSNPDESGLDGNEGRKENSRTITGTTGSEAAKIAIELLFPIRIYFDNDQPDPRSISPSTSKKTDDLLLAYMNRSDIYQKMQKNDEDRLNISSFFKDSVEHNYEKLHGFATHLKSILSAEGIKVILKVKGTASPLAESAYNLTLSQRRIESLKNYLMNWEEGKLREDILLNKLSIDFIPSGETFSAKGVSDDYGDVSRSVYSREAALERRIEIIDIVLIP